MIKAVIFDFDGLILDTETAWYDSYKQVLQEKYQFDLPLEEFVKSVGATDEILFSYLKKEIGNHLDVERIRGKASLSHTQIVKNVKAREGVIEYLEAAKKEGLTIALATSSTRNWAKNHLTNLNLISYFDHLITRDDVERVKPAPDLFLKTIDVLGIKPHEAMVFEDSLNGLIAAQAAGIPTVIVPNPVTESLPFENYHLKLSSMADMSLPEVIASLTESK